MNISREDIEEAVERCVDCMTQKELVSYATWQLVNYYRNQADEEEREQLVKTFLLEEA